MAIVRVQVSDKAKEVQIDAANANNVPALRDQVVKLAEEVEQLRALVSRLMRPRKKP